MVSTERNSHQAESVKQLSALGSQFSGKTVFLRSESLELRATKDIMPNPKRRHSQKRTATRRAHDSLTGHSLSECPNCHERKMPHRACPKCGTYKGREILEVAEKS